MAGRIAPSLQPADAENCRVDPARSDVDRGVIATLVSTGGDDGRAGSWAAARAGERRAPARA